MEGKTLRRGSDGLYGSEVSGIRGIIVMCLQSTVCSRNTLEKLHRNLVLYWSVVNLRYFNFEGTIFLLGRVVTAGNFEIVALPECLTG